MKTAPSARTKWLLLGSYLVGISSINSVLFNLFKMGARPVQCADRRYVSAAETETLRFKQTGPACHKIRQYKKTNKMIEEQIREITRMKGSHKKP